MENHRFQALDCLLGKSGFDSPSMPAPETSSTSLDVVDWGRTSYDHALKMQEALVARRIAGEAPDTLVFTEHEPVFTIGLRSGAETNLVWSGERLNREGIAVSKTNRGGDITYHGPGQIVGYPIIDISPRKDLHAYLRFLEEVMIRSVGEIGLKATRREGKTGIWVENRKIAAIGVAVRRWVTYHGFALNVTPNLGHFSGIVPCGITPDQGTVTSVLQELGPGHDLEQVKLLLRNAFQKQLAPFLAGHELA